MGFVFKTIRKEVGEISEEVNYHFEAFEDFMSFEKQEKIKSDVLHRVSDDALNNMLSMEDGGTHTPVTEIVEGEEYRIISNDVTGHDFKIGEVVEAKDHSDVNGTAFCRSRGVGWYVNVLEVEKVD